jgi:hypothetical protein
MDRDHDAGASFEPTSKRRRGSPSESRVKRGDRIVGSGTELIERLGRDDPCPCGSGHRFPPLLPQHGPLRRHAGRHLRARPSAVTPGARGT